MRKVLFKKWINGIWGDVYIDDVFQYKGYLKDTNCWETEFTHEGYFHQWANACTESDTVFGNYTVALVELKDGTIVEVLPDNIKFIHETHQSNE